MILDDISYVVSSCGKSTRWLCNKFNKERKTIYNYKKAMPIILDIDFICGLSSIGYRLAIVNKNGEIITDPYLLEEDYD